MKNRFIHLLVTAGFNSLFAIISQVFLVKFSALNSGKNGVVIYSLMRDLGKVGVQINSLKASEFIARFVRRQKKIRNKVNIQPLLVSHLFFGIVITIGILVFLNFSDLLEIQGFDKKSLMVYCFLILFLGLISQITNGLVVGFCSSKQNIFNDIISNVISGFTIAIIIFYWEHKNITALFFFCYHAVLSALNILKILKSKIKFPIPLWDYKEIASYYKLIGGSVLMIGSGFMTSMLYKYLILKFWKTEILAIYETAQTITSLFHITLTALFVRILLPRYSERGAHYIKHHVEDLIKIITPLAIIYSVFISLFSEKIILILYSPDLLNSSEWLKLNCVADIFRLQAMFISIKFLAKGDLKAIVTPAIFHNISLLILVGISCYYKNIIFLKYSYLASYLVFLLSCLLFDSDFKKLGNNYLFSSYSYIVHASIIMYNFGKEPGKNLQPTKILICLFVISGIFYYFNLHKIKIIFQEDDFK